MAIQQKLTIKGKNNSFVKEYCFDNNIKFQSVDSYLGDANFDGEINIIDVTAIQEHLAQIQPLNNSMCRSLADNNDGQVTLRDATRSQLLIAQLIDSLN